MSEPIRFGPTPACEAVPVIQDGPAIHRDACARHEPRLIMRGQRGGLDVLGIADAAHRCHGFPVLAEARADLERLRERGAPQTDGLAPPVFEMIEPRLMRAKSGHTTEALPSTAPCQPLRQAGVEHLGDVGRLDTFDRAADDAHDRGHERGLTDSRAHAAKCITWP